MAHEHLGTYLNDHLAGSTAALEILEHLEASHEGTDLGRFVAALLSDIEADRGELEGLMQRLEFSESRTRKASAWIAGKVTDLKLRLDDREGGALRLFEALDALSLGIEGKRLLWRALAVLAEDQAVLRTLDYGRLIARAEEQRGRVEKVRLEAAREALVPVAATNR
jgi:hypothetical protein